MRTTFCARGGAHAVKRESIRLSAADSWHARVQGDLQKLKQVVLGTLTAAALVCAPAVAPPQVRRPASCQSILLQPTWACGVLERW